MVLPALVLALIGLVAFDVIMETNIIARVPAAMLASDVDICVPTVVNASAIEYHSNHRYYDELKSLTVPVPLFRDGHTKLCNKKSRIQAKYEYCLPISGRKDVPLCAAADRMDLLNLRSSKSICYASVLHMLLLEVFEELQATGNIPFLAFGSLLGAVRNGSMIPFTEDVDIGFVGEMITLDTLRLRLRKKGYHMFFMDIWRVCVAPTHPLAGHLYDPNLPISQNFAVPYVDLYMMKQTDDGNWDLQELKGSNGRILPGNKVQPFSQVSINGMPFDTVADPRFFLKEAYGDDYMTPKPRDE
ncbi:hypothetical protein PHYSODRAFT_532422 [Phytophthora sojae]|uniref:LicD family protein n=1 Tax=Phytophthora sojae (strain P6497) TaxID=1094619 RepID=G5AD50_PHYSP|nr:hypothetical protein PHYSODRAFT_532422 [Phytophthora sojae]EGZ06104.1 hypothetical protein PHYSODRAFT_532422 [Phytophthora sojae]|eukprot:XP_009538001.1 hypothetical protein PHYSODRAFT_532422 [Phytophthora sojae]